MSISAVSVNQGGFKYSIGVGSEISVDAIAKTAETVPVRSSRDILHKQKFELSIPEEAIVKAIERANKAIDGQPRHAEFSIHKPHGEIVVKIVNSETKEVIHEYPPEKLLDLLDKLQEISGKIVDEKR
ncbi:flagellar protein FlaG [Ferviditalea candida]|uniref:Flagellar protein FlaG n=1 Tax=Ferviditalea candida TaxID=3108399 RepID=A0ABU5ZJI4_9BACL|nr:flagellar protein FlaG [Paenibacillaceae bacterium T2]